MQEHILVLSLSYTCTMQSSTSSVTSWRVPSQHGPGRHWRKISHESHYLISAEILCPAGLAVWYKGQSRATKDGYATNTPLGNVERSAVVFNAQKAKKV
jgi:hypothetical protein